jgi:hypothetical protein
VAQAAAPSLSCRLLPAKFLTRLFSRGGIVALFLFFAAMSFPSQARAWGCEGHRVVALLAEKHLTPHALEMAKKILAESPIDPSLSRYCKPEATDPLVDASTWPDDMRTLRPETAPWHYVDIPLGTTRRDLEKFCDPKEGCVTRAIRDELAVLRSANSNPQDRADALRFLIHFIGDLHQPLHAATNNDEGGNCVPVAFFELAPKLRNPQTASYSPNLHGVWDTNILEKETTGKSVDEVAAELDGAYAKKIAGWQKGPPNLDAWAWQSYKLATKNVYGKLPVHIAVEIPQPVKTCADDKHVSDRNLKLNERLEDSYQAMAAPIVREQVAKASARLALLLNQLWP